MRKPRNFDAELKALEDKARELRTRQVLGLGELVIATGADALAPEELADALIVLAETTDGAKREAWAKRGAAMFRSKSRRVASADGGGRAGPPRAEGLARLGSHGVRDGAGGESEEGKQAAHWLR